MSRSELMHQFFLECMDIEFDESHDLIENASTEEEKQFIYMIAEFVLQSKQKKVVAAGEF